jgi:hypothetical protein
MKLSRTRSCNSVLLGDLIWLIPFANMSLSVRAKVMSCGEEISHKKPQAQY